MTENGNLASILVKSGLISIFTNSPIGYFSKFANDNEYAFVQAFSGPFEKAKGRKKATSPKKITQDSKKPGLNITLCQHSL